MFKRLLLPLLLDAASRLSVPHLPKPVDAPLGSSRRGRGGQSPVHWKPGTRPAKHRGHAKKRGARAARRRARLSGRG